MSDLTALGIMMVTILGFSFWLIYREQCESRKRSAKPYELIDLQREMSRRQKEKVKDEQR
jgi:preprotein translocase subunit YajC